MHACGHAVLAFGLTLVTISPLAAATLRCPPRLPGPHPGFEQIGPVPAAHWLLWRLRLFSVPRGTGTPAELLPVPPSLWREGFTLTWHLTGTNDVLMQCLYDGAVTYYRARLHPPPIACTLQNDNGLTLAWCDGP
jgi:hypothetical protein